MTIELFGYITLALILFSFFAKMETVAIIMGCLSMYVAAASLRIGTLSVIPAILFLPVFVCGVFFSSKAFPFPKNNPAIHFLTLFMLYAAVITLIIPTLFEDQIPVIWYTRDPSVSLEHMLRPDIGNITQVIYALAAYICYLTACKMFNGKTGASILVKLVYIVVGFHIFWSLIDLTGNYIGLPDIDSFIKSGNYSSEDQTLNGLARISGTFTEPSFYATNTLCLFAFMFSLYQSGIRKKGSCFLAIGLLFLLILSLSTTAYIGLALYFLWLFFARAASLFHSSDSKKSTLPVFLILAISAVFLGLFVFLADGSDLLSKLIFEKFSSTSGSERSHWNMVAWMAFLNSFGLGIGFGSTFASSFVLVLLSNTGLIGTLLYGAFIYHATKSPKTGMLCDLSQETIIACREALVGFIIGVSLSYTVIDIGLFPYILAGAATGISSSQSKSRQPVSAKS